MQIILKKTIALDAHEIADICALFERVFAKKRTPSNFKRKFLINILNTSYHALLVNARNKIVGCYSSIPQQYYYYGRKVIFALSVETMIDKAYRGSPYVLKKLADTIYHKMREDGICFAFGFPNDNILLLREKILGWRNIGKLERYLLPIKINKPMLKPFNFLLTLWIKIINRLVGEYQTQFRRQYNIEKINTAQFKKFRYDRGFTIVEPGGHAYFAYRVLKTTAHIVDVYPLNKNNLEYAVKSIYQQHAGDIALISYLGNLDFNPINLIKRPQTNHKSTGGALLMGKILNHDTLDDKVYNFDNWNINLSNSDVFYHA